jgi:uncharacterized membrane protein
MRGDGRFAARVALLSATAYVLALASVYIPNVSLIFIVVFAAGAVYGPVYGLTVGGLGEFLWTVFNPYGMAPAVITIAQIAGMMLVGALGAVLFHSNLLQRVIPRGFWICGLLGLASGLIFQVIMNVVSAWLFGPFLESLAAGLMFSLLTIVSNTLIFPVCYPVLVKMAARERR